MLGEQAGHGRRCQTDDGAGELEAGVRARQVGGGHQARQQRHRRQHVDDGARGADEGRDSQQAGDARCSGDDGNDRGREPQRQSDEQERAPRHAIHPGAGRQGDQQPGCTWAATSRPRIPDLPQHERGRERQVASAAGRRVGSGRGAERAVTGFMIEFYDARWARYPAAPAILLLRTG